MELEKLLEHPSDFMYYGPNDEMFITWSLGPTIRTRDSDLIWQSNADTMIELLNEHPEFNDEWAVESMNHWLCGWAEHLTFRVFNENGNQTPVCAFILDLLEQIKEYPILDEEDHSDKQYALTIEVLENNFSDLVKETAPKDWPNKLYTYLWDNHPGEVDNIEDSWPDRKIVIKALRRLKLLRRGQPQEA